MLGPRLELVVRRSFPIASLSLCLGLLAGACYRGTVDDGAGDGTDSAGSGSGTDTDGEPELPPDDVDLVLETQSRRMTQAELDNTLEDLLGDLTRPARQFLSEDEHTPFDNDYRLQLVSRTYVESMEVLSIDVANRLIATPAERDRVVGCTPTGPGDEACFRQFIEHFGRLALRRPLQSEEIDAYATLQSFATEVDPAIDNDFYTAVALVISAIIQDPEFLYRLEVGSPTTEPGVSKLTDLELATKVSYLLWGSTPDDELLADAEAGLLQEPADRAASIERLLADPRARRQLYRWHAMWLGYRGIPHEATLVEAFNRETTALIDRVIFDDRTSYRELFSAGETYVDDYLADHYGFDRPAGGEGWVTYPSDRAGILSHGSVLASFSKFTDTSPTQRGILIQERLQCSPIPRPPPEVDSDNPPGNPDDPTACKEQRYLAHQEVESCAGCHSLMDPIGMGLENYDIAGVFRATDEGKPECTITGQGELPGVGTFSGPRELSERLLESGRVERCVAQQYLTYATGRTLELDEATAIDRLHEDFEARGLDFRQMMIDLAGSERFGFRREPGT
ncbi:DUF1588 domain-containing protein [Paraliomyxa miuraensis]|uniref:DUF1588 domain-containing protein n=1 Tax=Paraliomyxa miuraensis TaxID=376150 RepID=UPI0022503946|nr:DUF1588 domain-containing protein [Paraliomyxa miuraensis]MCX4244511.1 DUF1588 domain-containing protein [Paraliomyxa miuraensis]